MLEVSIDNILSQVFIIMHTYIHIYIYTHTHIHTHPHTHTNKFLPTVYYRGHLVITSYHKSYQPYFDILLNYTKLEIYCYKRKKNMNKWVNEIYSKEINNSYKV